MSLKLNERYPGRFNNPTDEYPQGWFKNRTTPDAKDGSYLEQDWANDLLGFFSSILSGAGLTPNGLVDEVGASQYFDALQTIVGRRVISIAATTALTKSQAGLIVASAAASAITITLPPASAATGILEFVIRRNDVTTNTLTIAASGTDKIMLDTAAVSAGLATTELLFSGDFLRLQSDGAGKWWCAGQAAIPPSLMALISKFQTAGISTYTVPPVFRSGRRRAKVTVTGGGGGGAHNETSTLNAGGGGGGGGRGASILDLSGVATVSVTVGAAGLGGASGSLQVGGNGGASSFGTYVSSTGGTGGTVPSGGISGTTNGDVISSVSAATAGSPTSIGGGGGYGGRAAAYSSQKGEPGNGPGGGGAGGVGTSGTRGGGDGKPGEVIVEVA